MSTYAGNLVDIACFGGVHEGTENYLSTNGVIKTFASTVRADKQGDVETVAYDELWRVDGPGELVSLGILRSLTNINFVNRDNW